MFHLRITVIVLAIVASGCAHHQKIPREQILSVYVAESADDTLLTRYAPAFLTYNHRSVYNRIGTPSASYDEKGRERICVNTTKPAIYYLQKEFSTARGRYTNLVYRVHFPKVPFSFIPFHLTAGKNVGVIIIITLDEERRPILVTSVGTCGCYRAIVPTTYLPRVALPEDWKDEPLRFYGERLPNVLDYSQSKQPQLLVHVRPGVHRVMDLEVVDGQLWGNAPDQNLIKADLLPVGRLETIPIDGRFTSFYHQDGALKGHVKGSVKPWETILLSLISLDFFVGTDKSYVNSYYYENPFYTSLKPWNRKDSNMYDFERFLRFWGWKL